VAEGGALVLVATPIGNLGDLSARAIAVLREADAIACEDTRHTRRLLSAVGLDGRRLIAVHEHNEASMVPRLLDRVRRGERVALVSDAGTPGISDPGERVVRAAAAAGLRVEVVPGPSAVIAALVVSGLPTGRWCFEGFLPRKAKERRERLSALASEGRTTVVYEAPHRLAATLSELAAVLGEDRRVAVVREMTKIYEETWRGTVADAALRAADPQTAPRGEYVIVIDGAPIPPEPTDAEIGECLDRSIAGGTARKDAVTEVASALGVARRRVYQLSLDRSEKRRPGISAGQVPYEA
jgi:16S rRNA (cytidine1402-2'-O)-methyltransferase